METELVVGNPMLHEFHIKDEELDLFKRFKIIETIYTLCLQDDERWHFFYEAEEGDIIRCSPEFSESVKAKLDEAGFEYKFNNFWKEELQEVVDNPEYFADLFHLNSVYIINKALKLNRLTMVIDRFVHNMFLNYNFSNGSVSENESYILCDVLLGRRFYEGIRYQYLANKKLRESTIRYGEESDGSQT